MVTGDPKILLLLCNNCKGMTDKLFPDISIRFAEKVRVLGVSCPSQTDTFAFIKLLKTSYDGVIIACPQEACCCPEDKKIMKRRGIVKDMLPMFGLHREQFQIASVSPFGEEQLIQIVENMLTFIEMGNRKVEEERYIDIEEDFPTFYRWIN
ncbi:MAG: hypothetical protein CVU89_16650 [Firmicutes bacterium HGW-Firmicutes-14]|nr:MAG: hypothetical protein CVU89_16650 [Firmicutes bacterium HGW-Firmicutes-14]